jgi:hypothetical protein
MNLKTIFAFLCVPMIGILSFSHADERGRKKEEIRQELLSIQAALDEMKGGSPEISFPPDREPEPSPVPVITKPEPQAVPSKMDEVERELQAVQSGLDQLNREGERFSADLGPFSPAPQPEVIPPAPPEIKDPVPEKSPSKTAEVERELQAIQAGIDEMNQAGESTPQVIQSTPAPPVHSRPPAPAPTVLSERVPVRQSGEGPGAYLIPSLALVYSSGFDWTSIVGSSFEVEESLGGGGSLRAGWMWDNFFADFHFTYARSELESIELPLPLSFSGDTEFFGFHLTGGGKVDLLDDIKLPFGIGVGGGRQEISMMLGGVPFSESDFVLTYHLFAGLEYFATEHLLFGMRYRLVNLGEMTSFSNRALQMLEFSCGYQY